MDDYPCKCLHNEKFVKQRHKFISLENSQNGMFFSLDFFRFRPIYFFGKISFSHFCG